MSSATLPAPPTTAPASAADVSPARSTFTRVGEKRRVTALVKEAKRVGYAVKESGGFSYTVTDPTQAGALVFKAVNVRPDLWATTYSTAYFVENT